MHKKPPLHAAHTDAPALLQVPAAHVTGAIAAYPHWAPAGQRVQLPCAPTENEPAGHGMTEELKGEVRQYDPAGHGEHVAALPMAKLPAAHGVMVAWAGSAHAKPTGQLVQLVWLPTENRPAEHATIDAPVGRGHAEPGGHGVQACELARA